MARMFWAAGLIALAAWGAGCAEHADVVVSPDGEIRSPQAAIEKVRALRESGAIPKGRMATVCFAAGTYRLDQTLTVGPLDSGIRFVGAPGWATVFSGGVELPPFKAGADGIWRTTVPDGMKFEHLWVGGQRAVRARSPNTGYFLMRRPVYGARPDPVTGQPVEMSRRAFFAYPEDVKPFVGMPLERATNALVRYMRSWNTFLFRFQRAEADGAVITVGSSSVGDFFHYKPHQHRFFIENCREALDAPGEWLLDEAKGELLYIPRPGETPSTVRAVAPRLTRILNVAGTAATCVEDVAFEGIAFACNDFHIFGPNPRNLESRRKAGWFHPNQNAFNVDSAIDVSNARRVRFDRVRVANTAGHGMWLLDNVYDSSVTRSLFEDLGAGGIGLGPNRNGLPPKSNRSGRLTVADCIVTRGGRYFPEGAGISVYNADHCTVTHNTIADLYYTGITVGWSWGYMESASHHNEISFNDIRDIGQGVLSDMGGIYSLGVSPGTKIFMNRIQDVWSYDYTGHGGIGIYTDVGSSDIEIASNLVYNAKNAAYMHHNGSNVVVRNNLLLATPEEQAVQSVDREKVRTVTFSNNVVWTRAPIAGFARGAGQLKPWPVDELTFGSNLYFWEQAPNWSNAFNRTSFEEWQKGGQDVGSIIADPLFVNPASGDWRLKPGSPAISIGFKPFDLNSFGVRGPKEWRDFAARLKAPPFVPAQRPPDAELPNRFADDFEHYRPGERPSSFFQLLKQAMGPAHSGGFVVRPVKSDVHKVGKMAMELTDGPGLFSTECPRVAMRVRKTEGAWRLKLSVRPDEKSHIRISALDIDASADGPSLRLRGGKVCCVWCRWKNGAFEHSDKVLADYAPGDWIDIAVDYPGYTAKSWRCTLSIAGGEAKAYEELPLYNVGAFRRLGEIRIFSPGEAKSMSHIDNFEYSER